MSENFNKTETPVDLEQLRNAAVEDEDLMRELVEIYLSETQISMKDLEKAVAKKDSEAIYKNAHKIVGGSLTCGMREIIPDLRKLEEIGRSEETQDTEKTLASAIQAFENMKVFLTEKGYR